MLREPAIYTVATFIEAFPCQGATAASLLNRSITEVRVACEWLIRHGYIERRGGHKRAGYYHVTDKGRQFVEEFLCQS
jgi:DNA-binding MarR family transcriptional regulator